jgi:phosphoglycolate phosphatase-like HAD superfamily hydrolase
MSVKEKPKAGLLVLDLDNTIWDWFDAWHQSFSAMLPALSAASGVSVEQLKAEMKVIHQAKGTSEYSFLLDELPSITALRGTKSVRDLYGDVLHLQNSKRLHATHLYPEVLTTLQHIRSRGVKVVAYTESLKFWTEWRIKRTGLDGLIDVLYSSPDHDFPHGTKRDDVRTLPDAAYELLKTEHRQVERGIVKPNPLILSEIIAEHGQVDGAVVYVGDSLDKDVAMAQAVGGVLDVHAKYGEAFRRPEYKLLQELSHWPDTAVKKEVLTAKSAHPSPTYVLKAGFGELLELFDFGGEFNTTAHMELWKKSVEVQMHFNDIGWRIRALALTALTFVLGATGLVYANTSTIEIGVWHFSVAAVVPVLGLLIWWAFWFMDAKWFHRLLIGSVLDGARLEAILNGHWIEANLGGAISKASPSAAWPFRKKRRSSERLDLFYRVIGVALAVITVLILALGFVSSGPAQKSQVVINNVIPTSNPTP